jgi:hypothetical protein
MPEFEMCTYVCVRQDGSLTVQPVISSLTERPTQTLTPSFAEPVHVLLVVSEVQRVAQLLLYGLSDASCFCFYDYYNYYYC